MSDYKQGHREGYDDGFRAAAGIVELERNSWRKSEDQFKDQRADALQWCWHKMSDFLRVRQSGIK